MIYIWRALNDVINIYLHLSTIKIQPSSQVILPNMTCQYSYVEPMSLLTAIYLDDKHDYEYEFSYKHGAKLTRF